MNELRPNSPTFHMETSQIEVESRVIELATEALKAFCGEISGMFGVDMESQRQEIAAETVTGIQKRFKKPVAVNIVDSEGALSGTFQFVFDREGLFTIGGITTMQSEQMILANRNDASPELAGSMVNAMGEVGNLLVGSWDRVFRDGLDGHNRFSHRLPAFVGSPWDRPEGTMGLAGDQELVFIPYEMTIGSYPAFNCGVIFPKTIFREISDFAPEQPAATEQNTREVIEDNSQGVTEENAQEKTGDNTQQVAEENAQEATEENTQEVTEEKSQEVGGENTQEVTDENPHGVADEKTEEVTEENSQEVTDENAGAEESDKVQSSEGEGSEPQQPAAEDMPAEETPAASGTSEEHAIGKVSDSIQKIAQSPAVLPGGAGHPASTKKPALVSGENLQICAKDIMQKNILRASPDESLQQALAKMRQTDAGYIMIERDGVLEGIVSQSDITGAMSPYLQPIFSKWRRPLDDATLKIRIKWVMNRPVRTIKPETSLAAIVQYMSRFRGRCLAVIDDGGKVQGLVTAFDIFEALLNGGPKTSAADETKQTPAEPAALTESA